MNYWLVAGIVLSALAAISTGIGTVIQQRQSAIKDKNIAAFQESSKKSLNQIMEVTESTLVSSEQIESKINSSAGPEVLLTGVRSDWSKKIYGFQIENVGNATADAVDVLLDYSLPGGHGKLIRTKQFTKGQKDEISYEMFPQYSTLIGAQAEGLVKWKKEYDEYIERFKTGERALIVNITLTYHWGKDSSETGKYCLVHSRDRIFLSKESKDIPLPKIP